MNKSTEHTRIRRAFLLALGVLLSIPSIGGTLSLFDRIDASLLDPAPYPAAKPLAGGPLRLLFIGGPDETGRSCFLISSALDCTIETALARSGTSFDSPMGNDASAAGQQSERAVSLLGDRWDVVWLGFRWDALPEKVKSALVLRVRSGSGLVYTGPRKDIGKILERSRLDTKLLRAVTFGSARLECAGMLGAGTVICMPPLSDTMSPRENGDWRVLALRGLMLASPRTPSMEVVGIQKPEKSIEHESMSIMRFPVHFMNRGGEGRRNVTARFRNERGETAAETGETYLLKRGEGYFTVRYPPLPIGRYSVDISISEGEGVVAVAGTSFKVYSSDGFSGMEISRRFAGEGEFFSGRVRMKNEVREGMAVFLELLDGNGHRVGATELIPEARRLVLDFVFGVRKAPRGMLTVRANLSKNNALIQVIEAPVWTRGTFDPRRFFLGVIDTIPFRSADIPAYERLAERGAGAFAIDMTGIGSAGALTAMASVSKKGAAAAPLFRWSAPAPGVKSPPLPAVQGLLDTLRLMDPPAVIIVPPAIVSKSPLEALRTAAGDSSFRVSLFEPFPDGGCSLIRPFAGTAPGGRFIGTGVYGAVIGPGIDPGGDPRVKSAVWWSLLFGMNSVWWFGASGSPGSAAAPGFIVTPAFSILADEVRSVTDGIDHLLAGARALTDPAALAAGLAADSPSDGGMRKTHAFLECFTRLPNPFRGSSVPAAAAPVVSIADSLGGPVRGAAAMVYEDGDAYYVAVVADPSLDIQRFPVRGTIRAEGLSGERYVYDVRKGTYRGSVKTIPFSLAPGGADVYAFMPYRVADLEIRIENPVVQPGNMIAWRANVVPQGAGRAMVRHVLAVTVVGPDGVPRSWLSGVEETKDGSMQSTVPLSTGESPGRWILRVRDSATGRQTERVFVVAPSVVR